MNEPKLRTISVDIGDNKITLRVFQLNTAKGMMEAGYGIVKNFKVGALESPVCKHATPDNILPAAFVHIARSLNGGDNLEMAGEEWKCKDDYQENDTENPWATIVICAICIGTLTIQSIGGEEFINQIGGKHDPDLSTSFL